MVDAVDIESLSRVKGYRQCGRLVHGLDDSTRPAVRVNQPIVPQVLARSPVQAACRRSRRGSWGGHGPRSAASFKTIGPSKTGLTMACVRGDEVLGVKPGPPL